MLAGARCQVPFQHGAEIERRPATNTHIHTYGLWEEGGAHTGSADSMKRTWKNSLQLNSGPFHNIMLSMNRTKYIFNQQENYIYQFREFWQPCSFFVNHQQFNFYYHRWGSACQPRCWGRQISCTSLTADILLYQAAGSVSSPELLPAPVLASAPNWLSH